MAAVRTTSRPWQRKSHYPKKCADQILPVCKGQCQAEYMCGATLNPAFAVVSVPMDSDVDSLVEVQ